LVVNHTSMVKDQHLVDLLLQEGCSIKRIFAPEHGFRGKQDAGELLKDGIDTKTKLPLVSLYGKNKKPSKEQLKDIDVVIFDIQDVGTRFYTYTSTMTYVMAACAEASIPFLVLDRPNPNGHYVDGPVLDTTLARSFVGLHPVPVVHGLTVAEYARMINEEGWLGDSLRCDLHLVECLNYSHKKYYKLPVPPSPNLPNMRSIYLYPSLCLFEATTVSVGRGTSKQFQVYGQPCTDCPCEFKPKPMEGAKYPKHQGACCAGVDLSTQDLHQLQGNASFDLTHLYTFYKKLDAQGQEAFFTSPSFFDKLSGDTLLRHQIVQELPQDSIRISWKEGLHSYKEKRKKYLLYPDFE
jgi:uncharacterized protein YbbC (DUF1343 family)